MLPEAPSLTELLASKKKEPIFEPLIRPRRLRRTEALRDLVRETSLQKRNLIQPLYIKAALEEKVAIPSMPGCFQLSFKDLPYEMDALLSLGLQSVILFGVPEKKDVFGSDSFSDQGVMQKAIRMIKNHAPHLLVISDICFCEYTSHGHCGFIDSSTGHLDVHNDQTLLLLQKQALSHAQAGCDILAPSGNMDGMVGAIRQTLDKNNFSHLPILSYSIKYASCLYSPFRQATECAPQFGNRKTYQMDPANGQEALKEAALDLQEGADLLMVKPAHAYLDILYRVKQHFPHIPLGAYHPSGEYALIKAAAEKGWVDEKAAVFEIITGMKRAGADFIITNFARNLAEWL